MTPTAFDLLRSYTDDTTLFSMLATLSDDELVFWLFDYGSRLARWRLCYELGRTNHTELARRAEFWVSRLNNGVAPGKLFPCCSPRYSGSAL